MVCAAPDIDPEHSIKNKKDLEALHKLNTARVYKIKSILVVDPTRRTIPYIIPPETDFI